MRIIYFDLDSMRPDHMGCYGYPREITPNLDRIAAAGTRFTRCFTQASPCVPSRAALFSGRFDVHTGVLTHWGPGSRLRGADPTSAAGAPGPPMMTRHLWANGCPTVTFSSFADRHNAWWFCAGWSEMHTTGLKRGNERSDEVNALAIPWLRANARRDDFFLHLQYWDPHRDYRMPAAYLDRVRDRETVPWPDDRAIDAQQDGWSPFGARELWPFRDGGSPVPFLPDSIRQREDFVRWIDGYDASIAFMDDHIGQILSVLDDAGVLDDTALVVSADHAEAQGEFDVYGDHCNASDAVQRLPLLIAWPGITTPGSVRDALVYNVDLPPTLCDLLEIDTPEGWDGQSLRPLIRDGAAPRRSHLVYSHGLYTCQRVVRTERWALTRTYHPGLFPFPRVMLHDVERDPHQTNDVAAERPEIVAELDHLLVDWITDTAGHPSNGVDPLQEVVATGPFKYATAERWLSRLESTGRADAAALLRRRLAGDW